MVSGHETRWRGQIGSVIAPRFVVLSKMPGSRRLNPAGSDVGGDRRAEFQNPSADRFIADINATFRKHFLNVTKAQRKAKVEPDGPLDY